MRYLSVCSGIEAATMAWHPLGWEAVAFSEIEPFACAVLAHHWPDVLNLGDMTAYKEWPDVGTIDLLVGGTPCQSFSVAGLRKGLDDPRGNLMLVYLAIARRFASRWVVWENVPGVLSSNRGRDFGTFLGGLAECGYGFAYRVLDAQFFGVPQRHRRVFVIGHLGDWRAAAAVLFERESLRGHPAPSREAGERIAGTIDAGAHPGGFNGRDAETGKLIAAPLTRGADSAGKGGYAGRRREDDGNLVAYAFNAHGGSGRLDGESETFVASPLTASMAKHGGAAAGKDSKPHNLITHALRAEHDASEDGTGRGTPLVAIDKSGETLQYKGYASTQETDAREILRILREKVGAEAVAKWGLGILDSLQSPQVLRQALHGIGIRRAARESGSRLDDSSLSCPENLPPGALRRLWEEGPDGCTSQGRQLAEQLARELNKTLPILPSENTPQYSVRRLTPKEAERLQGFPDDYTAIPYRGRPAADGPRYRALGNSMAVPVMRWLGERILAVEAQA